MKRLAIATVLLGAGLVRAQTPSLILAHVTVIDATGAKPRPDVSVEVAQGRILRIQPEIKPAADERVIDGKGKFLIPGLWDMHVHITDPDVFFPLFLAAGVTGVREMYSGIPANVAAQWRNRPDAPAMLLPGFIDGPLLLTGGPAPPGSAVLSKPEDVTPVIRYLMSLRADFLKVYNSVPRDAYFELMRQAREAGITVVGHVPEAVSPKEASEAGQKSEEHLINVLLACSTEQEALRKKRMEIMTTPKLTPTERFRLLGFPETEGLFDTYSQEKAQALFRTFVANGTWHTPTLALLAGFAKGDDRVRQEPYMQDLSPEGFDAFIARVRALLERHKKLVGDMHRAGVRFLAGTDVSATNPVNIGTGLHEELALLVESGFTPMEALQTATKNPAEFLGFADQIGTVEPGKIANLVLLDANPLEDIHNIGRVHGVMLHGRYAEIPTPH